MTLRTAPVLIVCAAITACGSQPTAPTVLAAPAVAAASPSTGYAGRWSGTVLVLPLMAPGTGIPAIQSKPFSFVVSADQKVTDISIGYDFNGCSGVKTFSNLSVAIGASPLYAEQGWGYASPTSDGTDRTELYAG